MESLMWWLNDLSSKAAALAFPPYNASSAHLVVGLQVAKAIDLTAGDDPVEVVEGLFPLLSPGSIAQ